MSLTGGVAHTVTGNVLTIGGTAGSAGVPNATAPFIVEGATVSTSDGLWFAPGTIISAFGTGSGGIGTYVLSEPALQNGTVSQTITITQPNVNFAPHENPINVYSFALQPEEHQPSGTCNFSRIDTTTLVFDSITTSGIAKPTKTTPFNFRIYAVNYNIFRVMSGMGGLAYSN